MSAYYNENDKFAAAWLRELIKKGLIADGEVDERSIADVLPSDLDGFAQCHFFAGIGGWSLALRLAGWPDERTAWTGSCPCQPFSSAGAQAGGDDPRHLWPTWFRLIRECGPSVVFGEQVESAIGHGWLDLVQDDLEGAGYACGAVGLPGSCVGAFDIRQRLWFVADAKHAERRPICRDREDERDWSDSRRPQAHGESRTCGEVRELAYTDSSRRGTRRPGEARYRRDAPRVELTGLRDVGELGDTEGEGPRREWSQHRSSVGYEYRRFAGLPSNPWADADWLDCRDGKARPVEPGTFPLAHGVPARVGRLRGYGNAIKPQVAAAFIEAFMSI